MLGFVNITEELSYQKKFGIPDEYFGIQYALKDTPLDFQYSASESVSNFQAVKVDNTGEIIEITSLSTSLITYASSMHTCTGLVNYSTALDCGVYYFLVNDKFQSDYFRILSSMTESAATNVNISISGLNFEDADFGIPDIEKNGTPFIDFGIQYQRNITPLDFSYSADESVSSFVAKRLDNNYNVVETVTIETGLISYASGKHTCTGLVDIVTELDCGHYYYLVNGHYQSDVFAVIDIDDDTVDCLELFGGGTLELFNTDCLEIFA